MVTVMIAHKKVVTVALCQWKRSQRPLWNFHIQPRAQKRELKYIQRLEMSLNSKKEFMSSSTSVSNSKTHTVRVEINVGFEIFTKFTRQLIVMIVSTLKMLYESTASTHIDMKSHVNGLQQATLSECSIKHSSSFQLELKSLCFSRTHKSDIKLTHSVSRRWWNMEAYTFPHANSFTSSSSPIMRQARCFMKHFSNGSALNFILSQKVQLEKREK